MSELNLKLHDDKTAENSAAGKVKPSEKKEPWETPRMEDVSEQVMAQPYIRFT